MFFIWIPYDSDIETEIDTSEQNFMSVGNWSAL